MAARKPMTIIERIALIAALALAFSIVVILIIAPDPPTKPITVAAISTEVRSVSRNNDFLSVAVDLKEKWDDSAYIFSAADIVLKTLTAIKAGAKDAAGPELAGVLFTFTLPTRTPLGVEGRTDLMNIQINQPNLGAAIPAKMSPFDIMEVGNVQLTSRNGQEAAAGYCAENGKFSPKFCGDVAARSL